jgi:SAM-dependent methyltransferase
MGNNDHYEQAGFAMTCRSYEEYIRMFACSSELKCNEVMLDVAGGASSFAAGARQHGYKAVSVDPLYSLPPEEMESHGRLELEEAAFKLARLEHQFDWSYYGTPEEHTRNRRYSLELFLNDYRIHYGTDLYKCGYLPELPFEDGSFTRVFCSHFLFLYGEHLTYQFHLDALLEMARVCKPGGEVRIYPLLDLKWKPFARMEELLGELRGRGLSVELPDSELPFIPGSGQLLCINKPY